MTDNKSLSPAPAAVSAGGAAAVPSRRFPLLLLVCLMLIITGVGYFVYSRLQQSETLQIQQNLAAIANLKLDQVNGWMSRNKTNVEVVSNNSLTADRVEKWLRRGARPDADAQWLHSRLEFIRKHYSYSELSLLDVDGKILMTTGKDLPDMSVHQALLRQASDQKQPVLGDLHWKAHPDGATSISLPMAAPLTPSDAGGAVVGYFWVEFDIENFLFPLIESWPTPSRTAETLIVRRDGDDVLYLNEMRNKKGTALKLRLPADHPTLATAQAVRGATGFISGTDNEGDAVIGYASAIPGTPWLMVAQIDTKEVYAPIRNMTLAITATTLVLLLISGFLLFLWWRQRKAQYQAAQLQSELNRQFLAQQNEYLSKYANDIILLRNKDHIIVEANDRAEAAYRYPRSQLIGKKLTELVVDKEEFDRRLHRILENRSLVFESVHRRSDGTVFPVEVSARVITRGQEIFIQDIIRDITDRKESEARERRLTNIYRALGEANSAILHIESESESELFRLVCKIAVDYGDMVLAWIGIPNAGNRFEPIACDGSAVRYLDNIVITTSADDPEGQGPTGRSYREGKAVVAYDFTNNGLTAPWTERARQYGIRSSSSFPIMRSGRPYAVFTVYSNLPNAFEEEIVQLLEKMAGNISFALDNIDRETLRKRAEEELKLASMVYQDSSEAMMVTDADKRIIAVNRAFEQITGYKNDEVIGKNPRILKSDRHDPLFFKDMWDQVAADGSWKGELWNKKKNGDLFAALLSINTIHDRSGLAHRYIGLLSDITEKKQSEDLIWSHANFDNLTGLPNRRMFRENLQQEIRKARRARMPLALMFMDLDGFKDVNDTLGHDMGDILLKEAAQRLNDCMRDSDTVARLGGDEFTVILTELHDSGNVDRVARHILKTLSDPFTLGDEVAYVSASIGITLYPNDATEIEDLIKNADQAMYAAKNEGKNRYHYFTPAMQEEAITRMHLINDLRNALDGNQFEIVYQPIVELSSGSIHKAEALIRWQHPTRGLINPIEFISAAEDTGMIASFGDWVFHQAAVQVATWREQYHPAFQISVNISPVQFRNEGIDPLAWFDHLQSLGLPGQGIVVEITEGLLLDASPKVTDQLLMLRDAGIEVALDDFGTGYSSLSYLKKFDIDYLKIDRAFVRNLTASSDDLALCEAIIVMAHKLNIKVIAEGIETEEQRKLLAGAGCDYGQGFLFSKPVPAEAFESLLKASPFACQELLEI
jgi:diguanylate cyclase (GGDEF)-like protein/PAS domain S-box-containing protein